MSVIEQHRTVLSNNNSKNFYSQQNAQAAEYVSDTEEPAKSKKIFNFVSNSIDMNILQNSMSFLPGNTPDQKKRRNSTDKKKEATDLKNFKFLVN